MTNLDSFTRAYIEAALWSTSAELLDCDDCGLERQRLGEDEVCTQCESCDLSGGDKSFQDRAFSASDISAETLAKMVADCAAFQVANGDVITSESLTHAEGEYTAGERAGHDFWLTRNGHGCGFWDGDWVEPVATQLAEAAHKMGEVNLYIGDDGKVTA